jgi:hypothetical protein
MDLTIPVGIYNVSIFTPKTLNIGEPLNITVIVNIIGLNRESPWFNLTMVEGVESVTASIVEGWNILDTRLVKGFRYAYTGFSFNYFNFYIEKGASMSITLQVISESVFQNPLT